MNIRKQVTVQLQSFQQKNAHIINSKFLIVKCKKLFALNLCLLLFHIISIIFIQTAYNYFSCRNYLWYSFGFSLKNSRFNSKLVKKYNSRFQFFFTWKSADNDLRVIFFTQQFDETILMSSHNDHDRMYTNQYSIITLYHDLSWFVNDNFVFKQNFFVDCI